MTNPLQTSMSELQIQPTSGPSRTSSRKKASTKDWSLPPAFLSLLANRPEQLYDTLLPAPEGDHSHDQPDLSSDPPVPSAPFLDAMKRAPNILTEKGAFAYDSSQSPLVDLFFDLSPGIEAPHLFDLLEKAWKMDPLATLKIVFHARSIHEGKGYRDGFFRAMGWIWDKHPRTLLQNLDMIVKPTCQRPREGKRERAKRDAREERAMKKGDGVVALDDNGDIVFDEEEIQYPARPHGSFDDLIALLVLYVNGQLSSSYTGRLTALDESLAPSFQAEYFKESRLNLTSNSQSKRNREGFKHILKRAKKDKDSFHAKIWRAPDGTTKHRLLHERSNDLLANDIKYQVLYLTILHLFVDYIKADLSLLDKHKDFLSLPAEQRRPFTGDASPHLFGMSYASKWVPTPAHGADRQVFFATALSLFLYPRAGVNWARQRLQKEILTPLRASLAVPEVNMSNGSWRINYQKVPSRSMARNSVAFLHHDRERFEIYLDKVSKGVASISGASLMPHEIVFDAEHGKNPIRKRLGDLQWSRLVDSIRSSSKHPLSNCLAIADVSGSMGSYTMTKKKDPAPIMPCLALTLLLGELAAPPWNGSFITFSSNPTCEFIDPSLPLSDRAAALSRAHWEMSTNFYKVFDLILETAKREKLAPDDMVKKLFVFSDMQFDQAARGEYGETEHQTIQRKFTEAGYPMPELVYWNLATRDEGAPKPVLADTAGVSLFSGYSGSLMKFFLGRADEPVENDLHTQSDKEDDFEEINHEGKPVEKRSGSVKDAEKVKKKDNPLDAVMKVISTKSFSDLRVVD
ncbi:hypothetical protein IAR55_006745 [Kwoniella newhampshirensis]|uniref:Uncharacterized protein n=1 Tax=Kwoniella newhampshirensis TaxID=1651941 RepID=A0AAW0YTK7_9TREE